ncbi:hypothetical protein, partial [Streptomyces cavourensis]
AARSGGRHGRGSGVDDDREAVLSALSGVFYRYVQAPVSDSFAGKIAALRQHAPVTTVTLGLSGPAADVRPTRAYGAGHHA